MTEGLGKLPVAGEVLAGKYSILRVIGEGGMGVVYEGRHNRLGQRVAIKVLREAERQNREIVARFEREARLAAKLRSANVARVTDVDALSDGTPFLVMEYLEGVDLDFELTQRGRLPLAEAVGYVLQACSAVAEAHALGIVHRDLKPHNLFLTDDGDRRIVKLLDFGISKITADEPDSVTLTRSSLGTPLYMSPEQIRSARNADQRSDLWSLGVILYELTTGRPPFDGDGPAAVIASITADKPQAPIELRPEMSRSLSDAILRALEKDPAQRFPTVAAFAEALQSFGAEGSWAPPAMTSSQPRISIPDLPRISADAITVLDPAAGRDSLLDLGESHVPVATSSAPGAGPEARRVSPLFWLASAVVLLVTGLVVARQLWPAQAKERPATASASPAPPSPPAPATHAEQPASPPTVAPMAEPVPSAAPRSDVPGSGAHVARPRVPGAKHSVVAPSAAPATKPSTAPPPAANPDNPLHL